MKAYSALSVVSALVLVLSCGPGPAKQQESSGEAVADVVADASVDKVLRSMQDTAEDLILSPMTMDNYVKTFGLHRDCYGWKVLKEERNLHYRARLMAFVDRGCITRMGVEYTLVGEKARQNRAAIEKGLEVSLPGCTCRPDKLFLNVKPENKIQ